MIRRLKNNICTILSTSVFTKLILTTFFLNIIQPIDNLRKHLLNYLFFVIAHCRVSANHSPFFSSNIPSLDNSWFLQIFAYRTSNFPRETFLVRSPTLFASRRICFLQGRKLLTQYRAAIDAILSTTQTDFDEISICQSVFSFILGVHGQQLNINRIVSSSFVVAIG